MSLSCISLNLGAELQWSQRCHEEIGLHVLQTSVLAWIDGLVLFKMNLNRREISQHALVVSAWNVVEGLYGGILSAVIVAQDFPVAGLLI